MGRTEGLGRADLLDDSPNPHYGATMVEIFHHGFERLGADAAVNLEGFESGWDIRHLKALRGIVQS